MSAVWPWFTLMALGAFHGINPGMGWLFAVALGLQERRRQAVLRAFAPIALGHALAIAAVVVPIVSLRLIVSPALLRYGLGTVLMGFGLYKLLAPMSHPRWVGMRVKFRQLVLWSFLMATAHGAGLMLAPILLKLPSAPVQTAAPHPQAGTRPPNQMHSEHGMHDMASMDMASMDPGSHAEHLRMVTGGSGGGKPLVTLMAVALHTLAMFLVMAVVALLVYEKIGLAILRTAWFNLDLLWAGALIGAGILTLIL
jgi:hypothetical protein